MTQELSTLGVKYIGVPLKIFHVPVGGAYPRLGTAALSYLTNNELSKRI